MNTPKSYQRLQAEQKIAIIERVLNGEKVSKVCIEIGISRTIFYKWLKEYKKESRIKSPELRIKGLEVKTRRGRKHWRKLDINKEREVVKIWLRNPDLSLRKIAQKTGISVGAVWNTINNYKLIVSKSGRKPGKRHVRKTYNLLTAEQKIQFLIRHQNGEPIARICREAGVSRTIFYRWMSQYKKSKKHPELALKSHRPSGEDHWRYIPSIKDLILKIVSTNPEFSLSELVIVARNRKHNVSRSGLYYMLKKMNLTTYEDRLAYSTVIIASSKRDFVPRFATVGLVGLFAIFALLYYINPNIRPTITPRIPFVTLAPTVQQTSEQAEQTGEKISGERPPPKIVSTSSQQDFKWGALALNSPKSINSPSDEVEVGFGVVDHAGVTICDADISLNILGPPGEKTQTISTKNREIKQSGECSIRSVTNTADYQTTLPAFGKEGSYELRLKAKTYDGEKEFSGKIIVDDNVPFEITRSSFPTRVYPVNSYPVEITIQANQDFKGQISETLPRGITASKISLGGIEFKNQNKNERSIHWQVDWKKNQTYKLGYNLRVPQIYPEFYEIGPLRFVDKTKDKLVYQEARYWQVVADSLEE